MKIESDYTTIRIGDLREIHESLGDELVPAIRMALTPFHTAIEFDLSRLVTIDGTAVDVLLALHEEFSDFPGSQLTWRVVNPPPEFRQLLELVRLHHVYEILPPRPAVPVAL